MVIFGAGCIGMSLATAFSKLGTAVTILEESASMLKGIDEEIVALYAKGGEKKQDPVLPRMPHTGS
jgi:pyruvate/2-oxoglutarate dehydrogenase complex dihydrolipoamide dehydrogenase (E3) component